MTPEEKEILRLEIKNAVNEGFATHKTETEKIIEDKIKLHTLECGKATAEKTSFFEKNFKVIAILVIILSNFLFGIINKGKSYDKDELKELIKEVKGVSFVEPNSPLLSKEDIGV